MSQMLGFTSHCGVTLHGMVHTKAELYYNPSVIYVYTAYQGCCVFIKKIRQVDIALQLKSYF